jgi:uncharacterized protein DUF3830
MAPRQVRIEVDGVSAVAQLLDDLSPRMAEAFWQSLPVETTLSHAMWSGSACYYYPEPGPMREIAELENPVCSIYPGYIVARPRGSEVMISYGRAEYRWNIGTDYLTPIAKLTDNRADLLGVLARMHNEGDKPVRIRREA